MAREVIPRNKYDLPEIEHALLELAICNGNLARASKKIGINNSTLAGWRDKYMERYEDIKTRLAPLVEEQIVAQARKNSYKAAEVAQQMLEKVENAGDNKEAAEAAKAFQQVSIGMGIQIDKTLLLEGRPTQILETHDAQAMLKELAEIAPGLVVSGTAIDVTPQQLPASSGQA